MLPISKIARLREDIRLNPFDVYIIEPFSASKQYETHIKEIWGSLSFLPAIFNLRFIDQDSILENFEGDRYLVNLFSRSNIFAGVIGPRTSYVRIEIANIRINLNDKSETEIELFLFFLQLCKSNLEVLQHIRMDFEFNHSYPEIERKLQYLSEIENNFIEIENYLKEKLKGKYLYRVQSRNTPLYHSSKDRLRFLSKPIIDYLKESDGDLSNIELKASSIGIDVPASIRSIDPEIKIIIKEDIEIGRFPSLVIQKGDYEVEVPCGFKEGIFIYTCTLLYKIENKEYRKKDFMDFLNKIYEYKSHNKILKNEMPESLKKEYQWYEDIFHALFLKKEIDRDREAIYYRGNQSFEEWCSSLLDKMVKTSVGYSETKIFPSGNDPVTQGLSRIRTNFRRFIKNENIYSKIDLDTNIREKGKPYKLYIEKENIFFPDSEKWRKIVKTNSHLRNTSI